MPGWRRSLWSWTRLAVAGAILAVLVWRLGTRAFLDPLHRIDVWSMAAAGAVAVLTTVCCAWRWRLVSGALGSQLPLGAAVGGYYRSQFLNTVLPGGVLGDVHRAVRRGRDTGDVRLAVRAVVVERTAGQVVQIALTVLVLLVLPSPVQRLMPLLVGAGALAALGAVLLCRRLRRPSASVLRRAAGALLTDLRQASARRILPGVVLTSAVVVAGHAAIFLIAARIAGSTAALVEGLPLAMLVLLAMALPTSIAGWGPREGAAAWVFAAAGLGAAVGVGTAVVYGVLALVATLPGAAVLVAGRPAIAAVEGAARG